MLDGNQVDLTPDFALKMTSGRSLALDADIHSTIDTHSRFSGCLTGF